MSLAHFFGGVTGIACLLYFLTALVRPDWFIGAPPDEHTDETNHSS